MAEQAILITGGTGQVGLELQGLAWPEGVTLLAPKRAVLDIERQDSVTAWFASHRVDCIINAAAFTAVDLAEDHVGAAFSANAHAPARLADQARERGIPLLHVSTDYVFDGKLDRPYREDDPTDPLGAYGASKLAGELAVRAGAPRHVILRTAWVISRHRRNFLKTILRLAGERPVLQVVADQAGCPTGARDIALALQAITLEHLHNAAAPTGTYHFVNEGSTTWHGLAEAIMAASNRNGGPEVPVKSITSTDFPTKARRPSNSRLETAQLKSDFGIAPRPWHDAVEDIVSELLAPGKGISA